MSHECSNYTDDCKSAKPQEVVSIPVSLFESIQGKYFVGQTGALLVDNCSTAWAGLVNPSNSNVNLFVNVFTVSNFSNEDLIAEIWLNTNFPEEGRVSHRVSPTNTAINPPPKNKVDIRYIKSTGKVPEEGVNVYKRIVPPHTTLVGEEDGKFIIPPDGNYVVLIKSSGEEHDKSIVAFGWWEKPR